MKYLNIIFVLTLFASCCEKYTASLAVSGYDSDINDSNNPQSFFVDSIDVIPLRSNEEGVVLSSPEKIVLSGSYFYILDNNRIFCYDSKGNFSHFIGERGNGSGEYISLASFVICNDMIQLLDSYKNTLMAYSLTGDFLYEIKAPEGVLSNVRDAIYEKDETLFLSNYIFKDKNNLYTRWNVKTGETSVVANAGVQTDGSKELIGKHSFCLYENNIRYVMPFSNEINSTELDPIEFQTSLNVVKRSELEKIHNFSIMTYADHSDWFPGFCNVFETKHYMLLTFFNVDYTIVNKKDNTCARYSLQDNEDSKEIPLVNILSCSSETLVGFVNVEDKDELGNILRKCTAMQDDATVEDFIILYHVK